MSKYAAIYLSVCLWALIIGLSFWASGTIDGPRNLDTGFKRLDIFLKFQLLALVLAIASAIAGFRVSNGKWRPRLIGLAPLAITATVIAGLYILASMQSHNDSAAPAIVGQSATTAAD